MGHYVIVAHKTHLSRAKFFQLRLQLGGAYVIMGRQSMIVFSAVSLEAIMLLMGHTLDYNHFKSNKGL